MWSVAEGIRGTRGTVEKAEATTDLPPSYLNLPVSMDSRFCSGLCQAGDDEPTAGYGGLQWLQSISGLCRVSVT